jgi:class 3 adenylate cyclase
MRSLPHDSARSVPKSLPSSASLTSVRTDLPAGITTFLFTDVEGSTQLLHELGAEGMRKRVPSIAGSALAMML